MSFTSNWQWLERDKLVRKLVRIVEPVEEMPRKVQVKMLIQYGEAKEGEKVYYKVWCRGKKGIDSIKVESIGEGLGGNFGRFV